MKRSPMNPGKGFGPRTTRLTAVKPLQRKTELASTSEPSRSPLARGAAPGRSGQRGADTPQRARRRLQLATWAEVRQVALERDHWTCVGCGRSDVALDVHHRILKGAGSSKELDHIANAVSLCRTCHEFAHSWRNSKALGLGWCVPRGENPAEWEVSYSVAHGGGRWLLDDAGSRWRNDG